MTKEELEKEVEEYLHNNYCCKGSYCGFNTECKEGVRIRCSEFDILKKHLINFAEPREKRIAELEKEVKYYQAREQESGWSRFNELTQAEFNELCDYLNNVYEEDKKLYNKAKESVCKVWERIAIARCGLWEMMFVKMFIQAYKQGKDSEVEYD